MIQIDNKRLAGIPTLCISKNKEESNSQKGGAVIILHGLTNQKEDNLPYAYLLAERGFHVFLPDALHHGERKNGLKSSEQSFKFWDTVLTSIKEIEQLKEKIIEEFPVEPSSIYLGGISMGAITTFGALTQYEWIKGAFSMMGSPAYIQFASSMYERVDDAMKAVIKPLSYYEKLLDSYDITRYPEKLRHRPLFVWHGDADQSVPLQDVQEFVEKAKTDLSHDKITVKIQKGRGHKVSNSGYLALVDWLCGQENV